MGIFSRSGRARKGVSAKTVIASGCHILGQITLDGDLHVDGTVEGTLAVTHVSVGKNGRVVGDIQAKHVILSGHVSGQITCEQLELLAGCFLQGDVNCQNLVVEKGAQFIGSTQSRSAESGKMSTVSGAASALLTSNEEPRLINSQL